MIAPTVVPLIEPPEISTLADAKVPLTDVVTPFLPIARLEAFAPPMVIVPFVEVPIPASIFTDPPTEVNPVAFAAFKTNDPPVAESVGCVTGCIAKFAPGTIVVISRLFPPFRDKTPLSLASSVSIPFDSILIAALSDALVSLTIKAGAVPVFVSVKDVAAPPDAMLS